MILIFGLFNFLDVAKKDDDDVPCREWFADQKGKL